MKKLIVFDLDGTLALSKSALDDEMKVLLKQLLDTVQVAIISGGDWPQFEKQILAHLGNDVKLDRLAILPTCGTKFFRYDGSWNRLYADNFSAEEKAKIIASLHQAVAEAGLRPDRIWGEQIEDRGSQITFSALGQEAPLEAKESWDPDFAKRKVIKGYLDKLIPDFSVRLGGATSVDITKPGIDKAYGIRKLREILGIEIDDMLFVGDALFPGGNDYAAYEAGCYSIRVRDPEETKRVIEAIVGFAGATREKQLPI